MQDKRFIGVKDLAEYLGVSVNTVYAWTSQHRVPYVKVGKIVRFDTKKVEEWIKNNSIEVSSRG